MFLGAGVFVLCISAAVGQGDPCAVARLIDEPLRSTGYVVQDKEFDNLLCDRTIPFGWYKFDDNDMMPTSCVARYHCGTNLPIWMNGRHPSVGEGTVTRDVCAPSIGGTDCCDWKDTIRVKNCGTFYAYELKPMAGCSYAYCAGNRVPCSADMTSPTGFEPGCVPAFPKMLVSPHLSNPIIANNSFHFDCDINFDPKKTDTSFEVKWLFDGHSDPHVPGIVLAGTDRKASLDQYQLKDHMGQDVSCAVRTYFTATPGKKSSFIPSNNYWVGIKLSTTRLVVGENDKAQTVKLISTIPIVCPKTAQRSCHLEVYLDPFGNKMDISQTQSCTQVLRPGDWDPATHQASTSFQVLAQRDFKNDGDKEIYLHFNPISTGDVPDIFNNYQIPYLQILTKDKMTSTCSCTGDPHCTSFDTLAARAHGTLDYYKVGEFTMYKSTNQAHNFEVQVRTWTCGRVTCNCAVAVKEGNDVIILDMCHTHYGKSYPHLYLPHQNQISSGTVVNHDNGGDKWIISLPSGAQVLVTNSNGKALNVYITPPEDDFNAGEGLCGSMDGNRDNDLRYPDGQTEKIPTSSRYKADNFVESWRIQVGQSFFDQKNHIPIDHSFDTDKYYCKCDQAKQQVDCRIDANKDPPAVTARCPGCNKSAVKNGHINLANIVKRRKRSATTRLADYEPAPYRFNYGHNVHPVLLADFPSVNGRSRAEAEHECKDAFDKHPTIQECIKQVDLDVTDFIDTCVEDFKYFDQGEFTESAVFSTIVACSHHVLTNTSFYDVNGNPPAFITTDLCPADCSGRGTCSHGTCTCNTGYIGDGCEIDASRGPTLSHVERMSNHPNSVLCDVQSRYCMAAFVNGDNIFSNPRLTCKVEELKFDGRGFIATGHSFTSLAIQSTKYDAGCRLPTPSTIKGQVVVGFNISLSNDHVTYSNQVTLIRTDSVCMNCRHDGSSCTIKHGYCLVNGNCMVTGSTNPTNPEQKCDPTSNNLSWTGSGPMTTSDPMHTVTTPKDAQPGGIPYPRPDIWTFSSSGCQCKDDVTSYACACCDVGACQCPGSNQNQCAQCGSMKTCGTPQTAPDLGVDGYTLALSDCDCAHDMSRSACACCQNGGVPCGPSQPNQCVSPDRLDQCGAKPWIFGPSFSP